MRRALIGVVLLAACTNSDPAGLGKGSLTPRSAGEAGGTADSVTTNGTGGPGGPVGGNTLNAGDPALGSCTVVTLAAQPVIWDSVTTTIDGLDRAAGDRIGPMYQKLSTVPWTKTGPALVARVGPVGDTVDARVAFPLTAAPPADEAAKLGLEAAELPSGAAMVAMLAGPREKIAEGDAALDACMAEQGKKARGDLRWYVFLNRADEVGVDGLRTRIVQPIE